MAKLEQSQFPKKFSRANFFFAINYPCPRCRFSYFCPVRKSRILAFFLLTAFSLQAFSRLVIVTNYHLNTAAFLQHCVNKARPKLKCKGQCQMMKQLDAEEKRQNAPSENKSVDINPFLFFENNATTAISPDVQASSRSFPRQADDRLLQRSADIFRPPA